MKWIFLQALGIWILLAVVAIINGSLRNFTYGKFMTELTAHQVSTLTLIILFGTVYFLFFKLTRAEFSRLDLFLIGSIWLGMTILFEFVFGHFVMGNPWEKLLADYNIFKGRTWILIPLWTWFGPLLMGSIATGDITLFGLGINRIARVD
jgi:hypothetical protein